MMCLFVSNEDGAHEPSSSVLRSAKAGVRSARGNRFAPTVAALRASYEISFSSNARALRLRDRSLARIAVRKRTRVRSRKELFPDVEGSAAANAAFVGNWPQKRARSPDPLHEPFFFGVFAVPMGFSVVVTGYDEPIYLEAVLHSVREQSFRESVELIVVEQHGGDEPGNIARRYADLVLYDQPRQSTQRGARLGVCAASHVRIRFAQHRAQPRSLTLLGLRTQAAKS